MIIQVDGASAEGVAEAEDGGPGPRLGRDGQGGRTARGEATRPQRRLPGSRPHRPRLADCVAPVGRPGRGGPGYHARGVDEDGYADWINRTTGRPDAFPRDDPSFDFHAWYAAHYWVFSVKRIGVLGRAAARLSRPVFLCGFANGYDIVWQLFDKTTALVADEHTIRRRLADRSDAFGKTAEEIADVLTWHTAFEKVYRGYGATIIDATRPLPDVVADILSASLQIPTSQTAVQ
jgi:hypothetical protein